jgi:hypothetical protein
MFSIASGFLEGPFGRQLAWIILGGWAIVVFAVGLSQPEMEGRDPILEHAAERRAGEETLLLRDDEVVE